MRATDSDKREQSERDRIRSQQSESTVTVAAWHLRVEYSKLSRF